MASIHVVESGVRGDLPFSGDRSNTEIRLQQRTTNSCRGLFATRSSACPIRLVSGFDRDEKDNQSAAQTPVKIPVLYTRGEKESSYL